MSEKVDEVAEEIVKTYNNALDSHQSKADWYAMHEDNFVLKADYFVEQGLDALKREGWRVYNIEPVCLHDSAFKDDPEPFVTINVKKKGGSR